MVLIFLFFKFITFIIKMKHFLKGETALNDINCKGKHMCLAGVMVCLALVGGINDGFYLSVLYSERLFTEQG